jgi:hypothetical protein
VCCHAERYSWREYRDKTAFVLHSRLLQILTGCSAGTAGTAAKDHHRPNPPSATPAMSRDILF